MKLVDWILAERVTNDSVVDEYLRALVDDPCHDNAVMVVRYVMSIERNRSYGDPDA